MRPSMLATAFASVISVCSGDERREQAFRPIQPASVPASVLFDVSHGSTVWARGETYKAGFDAQGAQFIPFLGSEAPRNFPISFALCAVEIGGEALPLAVPSAPHLEGSTISYDRGSLVELYRAEPDSLEQLFRFDALPRGGELLLRIGVETELAPLADAGGLRFFGEHGGARYGTAIAFDARGRSADAPVAWVDGAIEIRVGADFLAAATPPLRIDPLVTTLAIDHSPADDRRPDVAYDASLDVYAVCWERRFSMSDVDVEGRILDGAGGVVREFAIDATPASLTQPKLANIDALDRFLVATIRGDPSGPIDGRILDLAGGSFTIGPPVELLHYPECLALDLGGDPGSTSPRHFCLVAQDWDPGWGSMFLDLRIVHEDGTPGPSSYLGSDELSYMNPHVSRAIGGPADGDATWMLLVERGFPGFGTEELIQLRVHTDADTSGFTWIPIADFAEGIAQVLDAASGPPIAVTVREHRPAPGQSQLIARVTRNQMFGPDTIVGPDSTALYEAASVDGDGSSVVIAHTERLSSGATAVYAASYVLEGLSLQLTERELLWSSNADQVAPRIVSNRSSGGAPGRFAAVWQDGPTPSGDVSGAFYDTPGPGVRYCTSAPNSVGPGATIHASGSISIELDQFELSAVGCPPNRPGIFYLGEDRIELPFGEGFRCIGGATRRITPIVTTDASGAVSLLLDFDQPYGELVIPGSPGVNYQFWYRDPLGGPAHFNLSDALHVEHTP